MPKVALVRCESYDPTLVLAAVERGLGLLGGIESFLKPGEKILIKPNLLAPDPPEKCTTTHPAVFRAMAQLAQAAGAVVSYGDSPGMGPTILAAKRAGLAEVADELGVALADFQHGETVPFEKREFVLAKGVLASDGLISLPKLKTHALTRVTGSIKNQFGCIPGTLKAELHTKLPDPQSFCSYLVDLNRCLKPRLFVMDGIVAMEGNGPRGGKPKPMNILLFSTDPVALDATVCKLIEMPLSFVPTLAAAEKSGLGTAEEIEWVGDPLESFLQPSFEAKREPAANTQLSGPLGILLKAFKGLMSRPVITGTCIRCGICVEACPVRPKAVFWPKGKKDRTPVYQYGRCIRCFCCQEHCPQSAIEVKDPPLRRLLFRHSTPKT
ncbi:MAG: DUF362 domain-containing protein [Bacteroidota bacterium]